MMWAKSLYSETENMRPTIFASLLAGAKEINLTNLHFLPDEYIASQEISGVESLKRKSKPSSTGRHCSPSHFMNENLPKAHHLMGEEAGHGT